MILRSSTGQRLVRVGASTVLAVGLLSQAGPTLATSQAGTLGVSLRPAATAHSGPASPHANVVSAGGRAAQPRSAGTSSVNFRALAGRPPTKPAFDPATVNEALDRLEAKHTGQEAAAEAKAKVQSKLKPLVAPPAAPVLATDSGKPAATISVAAAGAAQTALDAPEPANSSMAAGPDGVLQVANLSVTASNRSGVFQQSATLIDFFDLHPNGAPTTTFELAPRVHFDVARQRWIATEVAWDCGTDVFVNDTAKFGHGYLDFAISDTADPSGSWTNSYYFWNDFLPDQPSSGSSSDKLVLAANLFAMGAGGGPSNPGCISGAFQEEHFIVMDWAQLGPHYLINKVAFFDGGDSGQDAMKVANGDTDPSPDLRLIGSANGTFAGDSPGDVILVGIQGSVVQNTLNFFGFNITTDGLLAGFVVPPSPHQPGGSGILTSVIDGAPDSVTYQGGALTLSSTYPCQPSGDSVTRDCIRVMFLANQDVTVDPGVIGDTLLASNGFDLSFGAVALLGDQSQLAVYTRSSGTSDPSSYERHNLVSDPWNQWSAAHLLTAGTTSYAGSLWGSYLGLAADPQDADAVWAADTYATGSGTWATSLHQLDIGGGSGYFPITPLRVLSSRDGHRPERAVHLEHAPHVRRRWGRGTIPFNADAITANVTVTGQTAAGFVSLTPNETVNPPSSTLNFPLGDTRANNVTIALSPGGTLSAVYKAVAGKHANVILDVTGYFLKGSGQDYFPMSPTRILDSRSGLGAPTLPGQYGPGVPGPGLHGHPAEATAITANLTVTGQTKPGYVDPDSNPEQMLRAHRRSTSRVGDSRANGLTIPIGPDGTVSAVYKAVSGTANVILDVTGYYSSRRAAGSSSIRSIRATDRHPPAARRQWIRAMGSAEPRGRSLAECRDRHPLRSPGIGAGDHGQPDRHRPDRSRLRRRDRYRAGPADDLDDQLPARRHAGQRDHLAARLGLALVRLPADRRQDGPADPRHHRLFPVGRRAPTVNSVTC